MIVLNKCLAIASSDGGWPNELLDDGLAPLARPRGHYQSAPLLCAVPQIQLASARGKGYVTTNHTRQATHVEHTARHHVSGGGK